MLPRGKKLVLVRFENGNRIKINEWSPEMTRDIIWQNVFFSRV